MMLTGSTIAKADKRSEDTSDSLYSFLPHYHKLY